jgi:hypothetical protein
VNTVRHRTLNCHLSNVVLVRLEFRAAVLANANDRGRGDLNDPQASDRNSISLTQAEDIDSPLKSKGPLLLFASRHLNLVSLASHSPLALPKPVLLLIKEVDDFLGKFQEFLGILLDGGSCAEFSPAFLILALHALPPNLQEVWEEVEKL